MSAEHEHHHHSHDRHHAPDCEVCGEEEEEEGEGRSLLIGGVLYALGLGLWLLAKSRLPGGAVMLAAYAVLGFEVLKSAGENLLHFELFDETFLMSISSLGAIALGELPEAAAVMFFYRLGEFFEDRAVDRSERSIEALLDIRPDTAEVLRDGAWVEVPAEEVAVGERILVRPGERIALDGIVAEGSSALDTRALTGESVPRRVNTGDAALSGCVNGEGTLILTVTAPFAESTAARIIELVRSADEHKAPSENFVRRFARVYTPAVVALAAALAVLPPLLAGGGWAEWIRRALIFLVVSCPCALVISVPLTFLGGIGAASRRGILVKGSNYLEALSSADCFVFDKTGTLTEGRFELRELLPAEGVDRELLLSRAAAAELRSTHPIARSILAAAGQVGAEVTEYTELSGRGILARADGETLLAGSALLMEKQGISYTPCESSGTLIYVARNGEYLGCLVIGDRARADSAAAVAELKRLGVTKTVMLTGDSPAMAGSVVKELGIDDFSASLLPEQKLAELERLRSRTGKTVFVGDGINDAPVLARADIGIAMGALGSDAAIEAADIVLMTDELSLLPEAIALSRKTRRIVTENIVLSLAVKGLFLLLASLGRTGMWSAVAGDVGVLIAAVLNAMRMLRE